MEQMGVGKVSYSCFPELPWSSGAWISIWVFIKCMHRFLLFPWGCPKYKHTVFPTKWSMSTKNKSTFFFFFKPPEWASLNLFWYSLPLILQMRKWDSRRALASLLPIVMTSRALEGNGWSHGLGGCEVCGVYGKEAASFKNEPGGVENSRPVLKQCC